jgi:hypothetical protein
MTKRCHTGEGRYPALFFPGFTLKGTMAGTGAGMTAEEFFYPPFTI